MDLYTCRTSRFGFSSFRSEPFFFFFWIYDSSCRWGLRSLLLSGRAFFTLEPKAAVRGLLYSVRVVIALSLTEGGREGGGGGLSRWTVRSCVMRWWREAERAALWGKASSDFTSRAFFLNQRAIKMKLHPEIMHETDVFMVFAAVFIVMHMHDGSISFFFFALAL